MRHGNYDSAFPPPTDRTSVLEGLALNPSLLPYSKVTGSGVLLTALTLGTGVIASDLPYFRSILREEPGAGVLTPPDDPTALANGIVAFLSVPAQTRSAAGGAL